MQINVTISREDNVDKMVFAKEEMDGVCHEWILVGNDNHNVQSSLNHGTEVPTSA